MKYTLLYILISYLLCASNSFDMKYSFLKHQWHLNVASTDISSDNVDKYHYYGVKYGEKNKSDVSLKSTYFNGGLILADSYILYAHFRIDHVISSCLFSMERKGNQKLALCFEPADAHFATMTLISANIPGGRINFRYELVEQQAYELLLSVNENGVTLLNYCKVLEEIKFTTNIYKQVHITDDMDLSIGYPLSSGHAFDVNIWDLDLYSPIDVTTLPTLCPNLPSPPQFRGENGQKGDKGDVGEKGDTGLKGDTGSKGESLTGPMGVRGPKGGKGDKGDLGREGPVGPPGNKGEGGSCECTRDVVSSLLKSMPEMRGPPGLDGMPGSDGMNATSACNADQDALKSIATAMKSIASGMKLLSDYIIDKTEQMRHLTEHITKSNERVTNAEQNIEALRNAMLDESQL